MFGSMADLRSTFVGELRSVKSANGSSLYYLPHTLRDGTVCALNEAVPVPAWWTGGRPVMLCAASYRPERVFDSVGYCGGQSEPTVPIPPRAECGCGPLLLGCLPPSDEQPTLVSRMNEAAIAEVVQTATTGTSSRRSSAARSAVR
jgi:hypothetical protein